MSTLFQDISGQSQAKASPVDKGLWQQLAELRHAFLYSYSRFPVVNRVIPGYSCRLTSFLVVAGCGTLWSRPNTKATTCESLDPWAKTRAVHRRLCTSEAVCQLRVGYAYADQRTHSQGSG